MDGGHKVENGFQAFLNRYLDIWRNSSLAEMRGVITRDFQAREITSGIISDFGYEEAIIGWDKGFQFIKDNNAQWDVSKVVTLQMGEGEMLAILSATIIINGISLDTSNLFFQTFKQNRLGEWRLVRSYIESGIPLKNIHSLAIK